MMNNSVTSPTPLKNFLVAASIETGTLTVDDAMGAVEAWLDEQIGFDHPKFSSAQGIRKSTLRWLLADEFSEGE